MLAIKGSGNFSSTIDNEVVQASFDRLVIFKDKRGNIDQRIVSFVPTKEYLARHKGDISHNRINKLDSDFDGLLVYRKWDGSFLFGLYMKNGKAVQKVSFQRPKMQVEKTAFREQECHDEILYEIFQVCYYEGDSLIPFYCDPPYSEEVGTYPVCVDTDPCQDAANAYLVECGGDGPPPEGGGGGPDSPSEYNPDFGIAISDDIGNSGEMEEVMGIDTFKVSNVFWTFHSGLEYSFKSTERGAVKVNGGTRTFHSLTHQGVEFVSNTTNYTVELQNTSFTMQVQPNSAEAHAKYKVKIDVEVGSVAKHYVSQFNDSYAHWNTSFQKLNY